MGATFKLVDVHASSVTSRSFCSGRDRAAMRLHFIDWIYQIACWYVLRKFLSQGSSEDVFCAAHVKIIYTTKERTLHHHAGFSTASLLPFTKFIYNTTRICRTLCVKTVNISVGKRKKRRGKNEGNFNLKA